MKYEIKSLGKHKKQFQTAKMKVPAILYVSDELMPSKTTLEEIEQTTASGYVFHHFAALSDVHSKKGRKNPAGTVVPTKEYLLPQINDTAPNCGMRFLKTNLTDADLTEEKIEKLFKALLEPIPTKAYFGEIVPFSLVMEICQKGVESVVKYFGTKTKNEVENTFKNGNFFEEEISQKDIWNALPKLFLWIGKYRLGILGAAGNHFLDLMKVTEIKNEHLAEKLGIKRGQYIFLMHTGSGLLGQYASYLYTPKEKEHLSQKIILELGKLTFWAENKKIFQELSRKIKEYKDKPEYFAYHEDSPEGKLFITAHRAAANHGFANRAILTHKLYQTIEEILGKDPEIELLYDMPHVYIDKESHYGEEVWVHRNNTSRALGPARMKNHPFFSETGEPVFLPSSMSTPAYLAVGNDENEETFFSAAHGTGRRREPESDKAQTKEELLAKMEKRKVKLFNAQSKGVVFQDASYYKDVETVIEGMEENKIVRTVAKMEPLAVLMY